MFACILCACIANRGQKMALNVLGLQMVVRHHVGARKQTLSSGRAASTLYLLGCLFSSKTNYFEHCFKEVFFLSDQKYFHFVVQWFSKLLVHPVLNRHYRQLCLCRFTGFISYFLMSVHSSALFFFSFCNYCTMLIRREYFKPG